MKYCILWVLTFGIVTLYQNEKPIQVYTGYIASAEISAPGKFKAEAKCFNMIFKMHCNTSFTEAEAEINFVNLSKTRNFKIVYNWPDETTKGEKLFKVQGTKW